jgi:anti-anti-sigma factor
MPADRDPSRCADSGSQIQETSRGGWARLSVAGELDISTALAFRRRLQAARAANTPLLLDLSQVEFMDSVGARAVLDAVAASRESTWSVEVRPPRSHQPRRCLDLIKAAGRYENL